MPETLPDKPVETLSPEAVADCFYFELSESLSLYLDAQRIDEVYQAYQFGAEAHKGQFRHSGEPYICHPLAVAQILADMRIDCESIVAAILHDTIEDTSVTKEEITERFGAGVAELVEGVSKLAKIKFESRQQAQAENFRKMMLAMVQDIRVMIIKLSDRLHNMRTLGAMRLSKRKRIARETLEVYAPIANRLGMNALRVELQDLGFAEYYPMRSRVLTEAVKRARGNRKEIVSKVKVGIESRLQEADMQGRVEGREKHIYSIYQKMRRKHLSFSEVFDVYAFRIIVDDVDGCYRALGIVHNLYKPVPGKFKDYIALPKNNGYQSLHTVLFGPYGVPVEIQIRADDMNTVAESGVAAHWVYKSDGVQSGSNAQNRAREWMMGLLELQKHAGDSQEFLESVKIDLFPDVVYVFTPQGKIVEMPRGSTVVDFAYAVHTDVGSTCVAAKVNRRLAPLSTALSSGQTVEVITAPGARPNPVWLNFVVTGKARAAIRNFLKNLQRNEAVRLGGRMLDQMLKQEDVTIGEMSTDSVAMLLEELKVASLEDLYAEIGFAHRPALLVARRVKDILADVKPAVVDEPQADRLKGMLSRYLPTRYVPSWFKAEKKPAARALVIKGTEGMVMSFAKCCHPIPGDLIKGVMSSGKGLVIHTESCRNVAENKIGSEHWIDVQWEDNVDGAFPVDVRVDAENKMGVLASLASVIASMDANIGNVSVEDRDGKYSTLTFTIEVSGRKHLAMIMRRAKSLDYVMRIYRKRN